jgi:prevent-host-death family protein
MKHIRFSEDVVPLGEFKAQASKILRKLNETNRPVLITQNGKPAGILITAQEFDRLNQLDLDAETIERSPTTDQDMAHYVLSDDS